uniref:CSON013673 protein n=1 Tax=Culicoides sonorensis TaxID=179676 RepID=A0A336LHG9_CULSO
MKKNLSNKLAIEKHNNFCDSNENHCGSSSLRMSLQIDSQKLYGKNTDRVVMTTINELDCDESESNNSVDENLMNERKNNCIAGVSGLCQEEKTNLVITGSPIDDVKEIKQSPPQSPPLMSNNPSLALDSTTTMGGLSQSINLFQNYSSVNNASHHANQKSPFLLPAQFYKNLFASAAILQQNNKPCDKISSGQTPFPRNLLFSCSQKSPGIGSTSDLENEDKNNVVDQKSYAWTGSSESNHPNSNNNNSNVTNNNNTEANNNANSLTSNHNPNNTPSSSTTTSSSGMPVPGSVQGQNPTQGLVHWMSAVMAEHMTSNSHHDPAVGMHYMWNGAVDQCGQHKDIDSYNGWPAPRNPMSMKQGYEAKMNSIDHHNNIQKGLIDDGHHLGQSQMPSATIYGAANALRSVSSSSNSPGGLHHHPHGPASALLVVPQPINASKMPNGMPNGSGRKYQCKMCPQD